MATRDTLIEVPLKATLDQGKDDPSVVAPGLLALENGILTKDGGVQKRLGADREHQMSLTRNHEARWVTDFNGDVIVGTSNGVYQFSESRPQGAANAPCSTYDSLVDHKTLGNIPSNATEIDSWSDNTNTIVVFGINSTDFSLPRSANQIWCAVYETSSGALVRAPRQIATATAAIKPIVVTNGSFVSFWWIDGGAVKYTTGVGVSALIASNPTFTVNTGTTATMVWWNRLDTSSVITFSINGNTVTPRQSSGSLSSWSIDPAGTFPMPMRYVKSLVISSTQIAVAAVEGISSSNFGKFSIQSYNPFTNAWGLTTQSSYLTASPADAAYSVSTTQYLPEATRFSLGLSYDASNTTLVSLWGTAFYRSSVAGSAIEFNGYGSCTTLANVVATLVSTWTVPQSMFTYAVCTEAFPIAGRRNYACGIVRAGVAVTGIGKSGTELVTQNQFAENLAGCIFVAPTEPPYFSVAPISKAFDSRVPQSVGEYLTPPVVNPALIFSMGKAYAWNNGTGLVSVFMQTRTAAIVGSNTTPTQLDAISTAGYSDFSFERANVQTRPFPQRRYMANGISVGRGLADYYDGAYSCEIVPNDIPFSENDVDISVKDGPYYRVIYSWEDDKGNIHRSAPTLRFAPSKPNPQDNAPTTIYVWDFPVTGAYDLSLLTVSPRFVELYQENSSGIPTKVGQVAYQRGVQVPNAPHVRAYQIADFNDGIVLFYAPNGATLYTEGGVVENLSPPAFKDVCVAKGRVFGLTDTKLYYSKPLEDRVAPEFNGVFTVDIPDDTGATTAIMAMDDKLVVLCERGTYALYGEGPNAIGTGGQFAQLLRIPGNIGCAYPGSAVECPLGIAFLSQQGMYLLDRGLNLAFIGDAIQTRTAEVVSDATLTYGVLSAVHDIVGRHVRWVLESNVSGSFNVVWYYEENQWGYFTSNQERQSIFSRNRVVSLVADAQAPYTTRETPDTGMYDGKNFILRVKTGWIRFANIEGFQRAKEVAITYRPGKAPGLDTWEGLLVNIYSDYTDVVNSTHQWTASQMTGIYTLDAVKQRKDFSISVKTQKTPAISVEFSQVPYELQDVPFLGIGAVLSGISVVVGAKSGTNKQNLATARTR